MALASSLVYRILRIVLIGFYCLVPTDGVMFRLH